jgi:hypothetical protein
MTEDHILPFAEEMPYWKTSRAGADSWIAKTRSVIQQLGGTVTAELFGQDEEGRAGYVFMFRHGEHSYRIAWPVLTLRNNSGGMHVAARVQAITSLYHHCKALALAAKVLGVRQAFLSSLLLPDGRTAGRLLGRELADQLPKALLGKDADSILYVLEDAE